MRCTRSRCGELKRGLGGCEVVCDCVAGPTDLAPSSFVGAVVEIEGETELTLEERDAWLRDHDIFVAISSDAEHARTYKLFHKVQLGDLAWAHPRTYFR